MKKLLFLTVLSVVFLTGAFAQVFTQGRLSVSRQVIYTRDSLNCQGSHNTQYYFTVVNSTATDTVFVYNPGYTQKLANTTAAATWTGNLIGSATTIINDYRGYNDSMDIFNHAAMVRCGTDTVKFPLEITSVYWPNPCRYDTVQYEAFIDTANNCDPFSSPGHVNMQPTVENLLTNGLTTGVFGGGYGIGSYYIERTRRVSCKISVPPVWQFLYPNSPCVIPSVVFTNNAPALLEYPFVPSTLVDVGVWLAATGVVRPTVPFMLHPEVHNMGYVPVSGNLYVVLDPRVTYNPTLSINPPGATSGDTLIWNFIDINSSNPNGWWNSLMSSVHLTPNSSLNIGDTLCFEIFTDPVANDIDNTNNYGAFCFPIVNSYDPNIKEVSPAGQGPTGIIPVNTHELTYTVHFQNTGNAPAINVTVLDTLESDIDTASFVLLGSTHVLTPRWLGNRVFQATFANIYLPDSVSNEPQSHGSFSFKVKLMPGLTAGTQIKNSAAIYFDNNPPIITNTATNTLQQTIIGLDKIVSINGVTVYPNPAKGIISIVTDKELNNGMLKLLNINGQVVLQHTNLTGNRFTVDMAGYANGVYFVEVTTDAAVQRIKLVKEQ